MLGSDSNSSLNFYIFCREMYLACYNCFQSKKKQEKILKWWSLVFDWNINFKIRSDQHVFGKIPNDQSMENLQLTSSGTKFDIYLWSLQGVPMWENLLNRLDEPFCQKKNIYPVGNPTFQGFFFSPQCTIFWKLSFRLHTKIKLNIVRCILIFYWNKIFSFPININKIRMSQWSILILSIFFWMEKMFYCSCIFYWLCQIIPIFRNYFLF